MKNLAIIIIALFLTTSVFAQESVKWHTIEEAVELNKTEPRKFLIDVYTDWCGWCKKMDKETFTHPEIAGYINNNFYAVKFDAESTEPVTFGGQTFVNEGSGSRSSHQFAIALLQGKMSYPSIAYMNENLQLLTAVPGYQTPERIEPILHFFAKDKYNDVSFEEFNKNFNSQLSQN